MTLDQLAHLLDQLKRPIEEAPRDGTWIIGLFPIDACAVKWEEYEEGEYMWCTKEGFCNPTHFLPLPKPGPVEFEIVPKDQPAPFIQGCISCQGKGGWVTVAGFEVCNDCKGEGRR